MNPRPDISVIINTLDRADALEKLLDSLTRLTYPSFEVVVVAGPSNDHTDDVLERWAGSIKVLRCAEANLSKSRNIGISGCAADFVAFIDDDAVAEPAWLDELMDGFGEDPWTTEVAAVGGWVWDHTGSSLQCLHTGADRFGNALPDYPRPLDDLSFPGSRLFPYAPGGNALYRRRQLVDVGGFDEEYEYYLEETDLSSRLIDRGWLIRQVDGGAIHHKFLPSGIRTSTKVLRDRYAVVKNKVYFSIVNGAEFAPMAEILADDVKFAEKHRNDAQWHLRAGNMTAAEAQASIASIDRGWDAGLAAGLRGRVAVGASLTEQEPDPFLAFPTLTPSTTRLRLCFLTQTLPPTVIGGIGRYMLDLARELADRGHEIHIVTTTEDHDTVDLEDGVWIHRIRKDADVDDAELGPLLRGSELVVPDRLARNAAAVLREVDKIASRQPLDAVYAAMWDVEQLEVMRRTDIPVVSALVTTFAITLRTRAEWAADSEFMAHFGSPLLDLERWVLEHSQRLHAISNAIVADVEATSAVRLDRDRLVVAPIGAVDHAPAQVRAPEADDVGASGGSVCRILFVGRFEKRKGIDLLLDSVPQVLAAVPDASFVAVGRIDLAGEEGVPYSDAFLERHRDAGWMERVQILGEVDDDELWRRYRDADVLVAPSRFESFGLIYVEAMMWGLPVVALDAGAAPEVVLHGSTGLLVPPQQQPLTDALVELANDPAARRAMGTAGRQRYESEFSCVAMADRFVDLITLSERV